MREIDDKNNNREILKCKLPVFACFTAKWCRSCYPTCLIAGELANSYKDKGKFVKVDVDKNPELKNEFHILTIPAILIFPNSKIIDKRIGYQERLSLKRLLDSLTSLSQSKSDNK